MLVAGAQHGSHRLDPHYLILPPGVGFFASEQSTLFITELFPQATDAVMLKLQANSPARSPT